MDVKQLPEHCQKLLMAKDRHGLSFKEIADRIGQDEMWLAALFYGQAYPKADVIKSLASILNLSAEALMQDFEVHKVCFRGGLVAVPPQDPVLYRFFEMFQNYGVPLKAVLQEKFGDGIISAINFKMHVEKVKTPQGDRARILLD
ncbi:Cyanate hydratase, partial [Dispira parvispora]